MLVRFCWNFAKVSAALAMGNRPIGIRPKYRSNKLPPNLWRLNCASPFAKKLLGLIQA